MIVYTCTDIIGFRFAWIKKLETCVVNLVTAELNRRVSSSLQEILMGPRNFEPINCYESYFYFFLFLLQSLKCEWVLRFFVF